MSSKNNGRITKPKCIRSKKLKRQEVLQIFNIMENQTTSSSNNCGNNSNQPENTNNGQMSKDLKNEFFNTGRVGRRNALPDILGAHCTVSTSDLPTRLGSLTTDDKSSGEPGPSNINLENSTEKR